MLMADGMQPLIVTDRKPILKSSKGFYLPRCQVERSGKKSPEKLVSPVPPPLIKTFPILILAPELPQLRVRFGRTRDLPEL